MGQSSSQLRKVGSGVVVVVVVVAAVEDVIIGVESSLKIRT
jgi:hypothetical protein